MRLSFLSWSVGHNMQIIKFGNVHIRADSIISIGHLAVDEPKENYCMDIFLQGSGPMRIGVGSYLSVSEKDARDLRDKYEKLWLDCVDADVFYV